MPSAFVYGAAAAALWHTPPLRFRAIFRFYAMPLLHVMLRYDTPCRRAARAILPPAQRAMLHMPPRYCLRRRR